MARIILIHGYSVGITISSGPLPADLGFSSFEEQLATREAVMFSWYQEEKHSFFSFINPFYLHQLYKIEKIASQSVAVLTRLAKLLTEEQPEIIVCHSLGTTLLLNFLNAFSLEKSVEKIIFIQSDIPKNTAIPETLTQVEFLNVYCFWDPVLLLSWFLNGVRPIGLIGWNRPGIVNRFVPLFGRWNLHNASIADKKFALAITS
ncbi:MAG: hypothetical protein COY81_01170 [Candidatus Pacebacteria bacterium CG_4_10_14_0_8_um_filter_43_12]|nr:MAG: hypothetical protein COY81_01170 [Candidatus Pacebacteria bacterium CG_4_10_14_0_8_um_filter_43_12]